MVVPTYAMLSNFLLFKGSWQIEFRWGQLRHFEGDLRTLVFWLLW